MKTKEIGFKVENRSRTETLNEELEVDMFVAGAKWQAEKMYSEEEVLDILIKLNDSPFEFDFDSEVEEWFEQFKKK